MVDPIVALKLIPQPNGRFTQTVPWPTKLLGEDRKTPAAKDDVISVSDTGEVQSRPAGTTGDWEMCDRDGIATVYTPTPNLTVVLLPGDLA